MTDRWCGHLVETYGTVHEQVDCKLPVTGAEGFDPGGGPFIAAALITGVVLVVLGRWTRKLGRLDQ